MNSTNCRVLSGNCRVHEQEDFLLGRSRSEDVVRNHWLSRHSLAGIVGHLNILHIIYNIVLVYCRQKDQSHKIEKLHHMLTSDRKISTSGCFLQPAQFDWIQATRKNLCQEQQSVGVTKKNGSNTTLWQMTREMWVNKTNLISFTNKFCEQGRETASYLFGSLVLARVGLFHFLRQLIPKDCKLQFKEKYYALCDWYLIL